MLVIAGTGFDFTLQNGIFMAQWVKTRTPSFCCLDAMFRLFNYNPHILVLKEAWGMRWVATKRTTWFAKEKNKILKPWKPKDPYLSLFKVPRSLAFTVLLLLPSGRFFGGRSRNRTGWEDAGRFERASTSEGPSQRIGKLVTPRTRTRFGAFVCWYTQNTVFGFVCFGKNSKSCHLDLFSHGKITSHIFGSPVCWFGHSPVV